MHDTFRTKLPITQKILLSIYLTMYVFIPFYACAVISQDMSSEGTCMCHHTHKELVMHGQFKITAYPLNSVYMEDSDKKSDTFAWVACISFY